MDVKELKTSNEFSVKNLRGILNKLNSLFLEKIQMLDELFSEGNEEHKIQIVNFHKLQWVLKHALFISIANYQLAAGEESKIAGRMGTWRLYPEHGLSKHCNKTWGKSKLPSGGP